MSYQNILLLLLLSLNIPLAAQNREIWEIQGTGSSSPFLNQTVSSDNNIVTAVSGNIVFIQTPDQRADNDSNTSNGLLINLPFGHNLQPGHAINFTGRIVEINEMTQVSSSGISFVTLNTNNTLPAAIILDNNFPGTTPSTIPDLEKVEGMRVQFSTAITTAPSRSDGTTNIVIGTTRTFREPGIAFPGASNFPVWDGNPEVFSIDPNALGLPAMDNMIAGSLLEGAGIIADDDGNYELWPTDWELFPADLPAPLRTRSSNEIIVGSLNMLTFFDDEPEYEIRLKKFARFIVQQMNAPEILAVQEVESLNVLNDLIEEIQEMDSDLDYTAYLNTSSSGNFPINLGFLVLPGLTDVTITPLGRNESLSIGGRTHDRPPLLLEGNFTTQPVTPIKILNIHNRSLNGITGDDSNFVRTKRHEQSVSVAKMARALQSENLIILGDFNAYQFSDGYADVFNQIAGTSSLGAEFMTENILDNPLVTYTNLLPESEKYSFVFRGNAQMLDHILSTELTGLEVTDHFYARGNADFPSSYFDDPTTPWRVSDHDAPVLYLTLDSTLGMPQMPFAGENILSIPNPLAVDDPILINLTTGENQELLLYQVDGKLVARRDLGFVERGDTRINNDFSFDSGLYIIRIKGFSTDFSQLVWLE